MSVTPDDVAVEIGRPTPLSPADEARFQSWIDQALYLIGKRYTVDSLDAADVDYVVLMAVAAHARNPENSTQVDVSVDDASVSKRYSTSVGRVSIWDDLWDLLDPDVSDDGAFTISPFGATDRLGDLSYGDQAWRIR